MSEDKIFEEERIVSAPDNAPASPRAAKTSATRTSASGTGKSPASAASSAPADKPEAPERIRKLPAQIVRISDLKPSMKRVCVAGTVVSKNEELYSFIVDDGAGKVLVLLNDVERFQKIAVGQFVRVFAKIWGEGDEIELQADVVQDFSKIDKELYSKLF